MEAQRAFTEAGSEVQSVDIKLKHVSTAAKQKDKAAEKEMKEFTALKKKCEQKEAEATKLQAQLKVSKRGANHSVRDAFAGI